MQELAASGAEMAFRTCVPGAGGITGLRATDHLCESTLQLLSGLFGEVGGRPSVLPETRDLAATRDPRQL